MKKILSILMVLAIVMSSFSMITVNAAGTEWEVTTNGYFPDKDTKPNYSIPDDWICTDELEESGIYYTVKDGKATCERYIDIDNGIAKNYTIPTTLGGYPVVAVASNAYGYKEYLVNLTIPDCIESLGDNLFRYMENLETVKIGSGLKSIGTSVFAECYKFTEITVSEDNKYFTAVDNVLFTKDMKTLVRYPAGKTEKTYQIPSSVTKIGDAAFETAQLKSIVIPDTVTEIGAGAFSGCTDLEEITLGKNLKSIGKEAFTETDALKKITIPASVEYIGDYAFNSNNLTEIKVEQGNKNYASVEGVLFTKDMKTLIKYPEKKEGTSYTVPEKVEKLSECAFIYTSLETVSIPDSVKNYGEHLFAYSKSLKNVTLSESADKISKSMFDECTALKSIIIPDSVTEIGDYAFYSCGGLTEVKNGINLKTIGTKAFYSCKKLLTLTLPDSVTTIKELAFSECKNLKIYCSNTSTAAFYAEKNNIPCEYIGVLRARSLKLNATTIKWPISKSGHFKPTILPAEASQVLEWTTSNPKVATVNENGKLTAVASGTAVITCKTTDGTNLSASCNVTVGNLVSEVKLNVTALTWGIGRSGSFKPTVTPEDATDKTLVWTSSDTDVAKVDANGKLTAVGVGTATITCQAKYGNEASATCVVTVKDVASNLKLNTNVINWPVGKAGHFKPTVLPAKHANQKLSWTSSNTKVATVNSNGKLTAKASGTATITCKTTDGSNLKATCTVTVGKRVTSLKLNCSSLTWPTGKSGSFKPTITPTTAYNQSLRWTSSNPSVAKVDANGKLTTLKEGTTTITCKLKDDSSMYATCKVKVSNKITSIKLNATSIVWESGKSGSFKPTVTPAISSDKIYFRSLNPEVATVTSNGKLTAVSQGTAKIVCSSTDGSNIDVYCQVLVYYKDNMKLYRELYNEYFKDGTYAINGTVDYVDEDGYKYKTKVQMGVTKENCYMYEINDSVKPYTKTISGPKGTLLLMPSLKLGDYMSTAEAKELGIPTSYLNKVKNYYTTIDTTPIRSVKLENLNFSGSGILRNEAEKFTWEKFQVDGDSEVTFYYDKNDKISHISIKTPTGEFTVNVTGIQGTFKISDYSIPSGYTKLDF